MRKYYTLFVKEDGVWAMQFGSYDRSDVDFERLDYRDHGVKLTDTKVTTWTSCPSQRQIDEAVTALNN